ncbi:response regulator [Paenibacillus sp. YN15]|uniref:response regulator n=1 Tax=Paenibacillus sp. YN15 TaxID=1742774 RepID=UPI000DCCA70C|nr:response regulator [Paenibacillus sp. YN15]RAU92952.1 hybrid sensor histidine kinase/response regulator [Paenibacillus sp. YN15]
MQQAADIPGEAVEIIIVDDRKENLFAMEAVLADPAYRLTCLNSGEALLDYMLNADASQVAVILLDIQMPGMDGLEAARFIKSRKSFRNIPILFVTAHSQTESGITNSYSTGAIDYVQKPFNPDILRYKIRALVRVHHYQQELERANRRLRQKTLELERNNRMLAAAEEKLNRVNQELEQTVEKRTASLVRAYQEIRESHLLFRTVFSTSPCMLAIRSVEDEFLDVNDAWRELSGYSLEEMNRMPEPYLDMKLLEQESFTADEQALFHRNAKIQFQTKTGAVRFGLLSEQPLLLEGVPKLLIVIMDITEKEHWESQSARLERLHLIGEMAAAIAHEVRNPMTTVSGFLQLYKRQRRELTEESVNMMLEEINRANSIITEFLTLAKNKSSDLQPRSLNAIVESIFPLIQAEAVMNSKQALAELKPIPALRLDEKEIRQMILNMALNGLDSMEPGGTLRIETAMDGTSVLLTIADEGCGMTEDVVQKLGTPFYTTKDSGTGLGLAVCYSIASRHNASIRVETGSQGSKFIISFTPPQQQPE